MFIASIDQYEQGSCHPQTTLMLTSRIIIPDTIMMKEFEILWELPKCDPESKRKLMCFLHTGLSQTFNLRCWGWGICETRESECSTLSWGTLVSPYLKDPENKSFPADSICHPHIWMLSLLQISLFCVLWFSSPNPEKSCIKFKGDIEAKRKNKT